MTEGKAQFRWVTEQESAYKMQKKYTQRCAKRVSDNVVEDRARESIDTGDPKARVLLAVLKAAEIACY